MNSREIKFRVWNVKKNRFISQCNFAILGNGKLIITESGYYNHFTNTNDEDYVIQQYTGLFDCNKKEIYEGDIVKYKVWFGRNPDTEYDHFTKEVIYENGAFYPRYIDDECEDSWYSYKSYDLEVIGNVFETPELVK